MNQFDPENNSEGKSPQPDAPPPVRYDLGAMLKENPYLYFVHGIHDARMSRLSFRLRARVSFRSIPQSVNIEGINAVDYSIRPPDPAILEGGPPMEYFEEHPRLTEDLQQIPHTDIEYFNPPIKFNLLLISQSYFIAQQFILCVENDTGIDEQRKQQDAETIRQGLEWMEKFRLPALQKARV